MANITGRRTVHTIKVYEVDSDPSSGAGTVATVGTIASATDGSGIYVKNSASDTDWSLSSSGGSITGSGIAGRVTFWNNATNISSSASLLWDDTLHKLTVSSSLTALEVDGAFIVSPATQTSGAFTSFSLTAPTRTGQTAGSEITDALIDLSSSLQHASNTTVANNRSISIVAPVHTHATAGGIITNASTIYVSGPPSGGTNSTITNGAAIEVPELASSSGITNAYGLRIGQTTGASTNYAAQFYSSQDNPVFVEIRHTGGTEGANSDALLHIAEGNGNGIRFSAWNGDHTPTITTDLPSSGTILTTGGFSNGLGLAADSTNPITFWTNRIQRAQITGAGIFGIGSASQLQIATTGEPTLTHSWDGTTAFTASNANGGSSARAIVDLLSDSVEASFQAFSSTFTTYANVVKLRASDNGGTLASLMVETGTTAPILFRPNEVEAMRVATIGADIVTITGGTLAAGKSAFLVSATSNASPSGSRSMAVFNLTTAGSGGDSEYGLVVNMNAGFTGAASTYAFSPGNAAQGTGGVDPLTADLAQNVGNLGIYATATGSIGSGVNSGGMATGALSPITVGFAGYAGHSQLTDNGFRIDSLNYGLIGAVTLAKNAGSSTEKHIGVLGAALHGDINVAGYFGLQSSVPAFTNAALIADNGATAADIFVARDSGLAVATIPDGGGLNIGTTNQFQISSSGNIVKLNNVLQSWPSSQGAANTILQNDGYGSLSWSILSSNAITSQTTVGLDDGDFGYISSANTWLKAQSDGYDVQAICIGASLGLSSEMALPGAVIANAKFITAGGIPLAGAEVYLAASSDDGGTGAGKCTATAPSSGFLTTIGVCIDASNYTSFKTSKIIFRPTTPINLAD